MEKIVADRLMYIMESKGLISDAQAGFRQNRCTTDQVLKMTQCAADQMQETPGHNATVVTFFDYSKAYDKVWRDGLQNAEAGDTTQIRPLHEALPERKKDGSQLQQHQQQNLLA